MAKEKIKLVPVKITSNVSWKNKILTKGSLHEVSEEDALILIEGKHAEEHVLEKSLPGEVSGGLQSRGELFKQFSKATKAQLLAVQADSAAVLQAEPGRIDAKSVNEVVTELLKKFN